MAYEAKPGSFSLFKNDKKEADNHSDYKGDGKDLDGNAVWVSAWLKEGKSGKFMSCSFKLKEDKPVVAAAKKQEFSDFDQEIPF